MQTQQTPLKNTKADPKDQYAIVKASYNAQITNNLLKAAKQTLQENGVTPDNITTIEAPGAYELPLIAKKLAQTKKYAAIITLGAIIKGETPHFDFISTACAQGIMQTMLDTNTPITFGVITTNDLEQAQARATDNQHNKGREAALTALAMANITKEIAQ